MVTLMGAAYRLGYAVLCLERQEPAVGVEVVQNKVEDAIDSDAYPERPGCTRHRIMPPYPEQPQRERRGCQREQVVEFEDAMAMLMGVMGLMDPPEDAMKEKPMDEIRHHLCRCKRSEDQRDEDEHED